MSRHEGDAMSVGIEGPALTDEGDDDDMMMKPPQLCVVATHISCHDVVRYDTCVRCSMAMHGVLALRGGLRSVVGFKDNVRCGIFKAGGSTVVKCLVSVRGFMGLMLWKYVGDWVVF